nr:WAT1-related protein At5g64700-like [Ipomoea batatas]
MHSEISAAKKKRALVRMYLTSQSLVGFGLNAKLRQTNVILSSVQAKLFKKFPYMYSATTVVSMIATFQSLGSLATAATFCLISWAISKTGPTYPSMFNPLSLIAVAIMEFIFLGASISIGSLIGMTLIIAGLYLFLWGKNMEMKNAIKSNTAKSLGQLIAEEGGAVVPSSYSSNEHFSAVVVPASSPSYDNCIEIESGNEQVNVVKS